MCVFRVMREIRFIYVFLIVFREWGCMAQSKKISLALDRQGIFVSRIISSIVLFFSVYLLRKMPTEGWH